MHIKYPNCPSTKSQKDRNHQINPQKKLSRNIVKKKIFIFCYYACLTFLKDPTAGLFAPSLLSLYPMADLDRSSLFLAVEKILSPSLRALDALLPPERIDQPRRDGVSARAGVRGTLGWS